MRRRDFIQGVAVSSAWPLAARAQQLKLPIIGFLGSESAFQSPWTAAFAQRLRELGWIEGRTIAIEYRWNEGRPERTKEIAADFIRLKVDVIVTNALAVPILKQATTVIPIVFPIAQDPVGGGLVASLARPGGNVTGQSIQAIDLASKRLELLREVVPRIHRLAIVFNADFSGTVAEAEKVKATARALGLEIATFEVRRAGDITRVFEMQADALYVVGDALIAANIVRIITLASAARMPTIFPTGDYVKAGGLVAYGPNYPELFRRGAEIVDKILHGTKPADIPVEQASKFDLVINLTTAKALGLTIPESLLVRADEVIE